MSDNHYTSITNNNEYDISDHPMVLNWMKDLAKNDPLALITLTGGNEKLFKSLFGDSNGRTKRFAYWKKEHLGMNFIIYSNDVNTFYKIHHLGEYDNFVQDKKIGVYITGFMNKTLKDMSSKFD